MTRGGVVRDVIIAGSVMLDVLAAPVPAIPAWDRSLFIDQARLSVGGLAANTASCFARLGAAPRIVARVGKDSFGSFIRDRLRKAGVDCRHLSADPKETTSLSLGFVHPRGRRLFVVARGANRNLRSADFRGVRWSEADVFHVGGFFHLPRLEADLPMLLCQVQNRGLITSLDLAWDADGRWMRAIGPSLKHADVFFPNLEQSRRLAGERDVHRCAARLRASGVRIVVIKMGARGCYVRSDLWSGSVPAYHVAAIDTTGAGDNFDAAFLMGLREGWPLRRCAQFANTVAALSTLTYGASAAIPTRAVAMRLMQRFYGQARDEGDGK